MANIPGDPRNRKGCFIILSILALFIVFAVAVGLRQQPGNNLTEKIQPAPVTNSGV